MTSNAINATCWLAVGQQWFAQSLKRRVTLIAITVFFISLCALAYYANAMARQAMLQMLAEQQFASVSLVADSINEALLQRVKQLEQTAATIDADALAKPQDLPALLKEKMALNTLFNAGWRVVGTRGETLASNSVSGHDTIDPEENLVAKTGLTAAQRIIIGKPFLDTAQKQSVFSIAVAIINPQHQVVGALVANTELATLGLFDPRTNTEANSDPIFLLPGKHHSAIATPEQGRVIEILQERRANIRHKLLLTGFEGSEVMVNASDEEMLLSAKKVAIAGWHIMLANTTEAAFAPIFKIRQQIAQAIVALTFLVFGLLWWLLKNQLKPLNMVAAQLASRSSTEDVFRLLPNPHHDEIGHCIAALNHLLAMLAQREMALEANVSHWKREYTTSKRILDALPVGIWIGDCAGNLKQNNPAGQAIWAGERWVGMEGYGQYKGWWSDTGRALAPQEWGMARAITTGEKSTDEMIDIECFDGTRKTILNSAQIIYDADGKPNCALVVNQDITQIKLAQDELKQTRRQLEGLALQLLSVQEKERHDLSRELHDEIGQSLTALKITLDTALRRKPTDEIVNALTLAIQIVDTLLDNIRHIARGLRPPQIDELGLLPALRWHIDNTAQTVSLPIDFEWNIGEWRFSQALELCCFRVAQEAITNAVRHARASRIQVSLMLRDGRLQITVRDDGVGFDVNRLYRPSTHPLPLGLVGMRERIAGFRGELLIDSSPGAGTEIRAIFPREEFA